jgi:hypothetical protein
MDFFAEHAGALLQLPAEFKMFLFIAIVAMIVIGLIKKLFTLAKYALIAAAAYFVLNYIGII